MAGTKSTLVALLGVVLAGCSYIPVIPGATPYKMEIQQGNFVSQEMISRLQLGMTREQVRFVLGTPLVTDIFRTNRWDYIYSRQAAGGLSTERRYFSVYFEDAKLTRIEGDVIPQGGAGRASTGKP